MDGEARPLLPFSIMFPVLYEYFLFHISAYRRLRIVRQFWLPVSIWRMLRHFGQVSVGFLRPARQADTSPSEVERSGF